MKLCSKSIHKSKGSIGNEKEKVLFLERSGAEWDPDLRSRKLTYNGIQDQGKYQLQDANRSSAIIYLFL